MANPGFIAALLGLLIAMAGAQASAQPAEPRTVVVRTVGTSPSWGQEPVPAWSDAAPTKRAAAFVLYDLEIARNAAGAVEYLSLLQFENDPFDPGMTPEDWTALRNAHEVARIDLSRGGQAPYAAFLEIFEALFQVVDDLFFEFVIPRDADFGVDVFDFFHQAAHLGGFRAFVHAQTGSGLVDECSGFCGV